MRFKRFAAVCLLAVSFLAFTSVAIASPGLNAFQQRFEIRYNAKGEVDLVSLRTKSRLFSLRALMEEIKKDAIFLAVYGPDVKEHLFPAGEPEKESAEWQHRYVRYSQEALDWVQSIDLELVIRNEQLNRFVEKLETKIGDHLIGHRVLASPRDPYFFQARDFFKQVLSWAEDYITQQFSSVPVLNIAFFIVDRTIEMINERRTYYQFMLMHYLDRYYPEELGMTETDVRNILSSIFSEDIEWYEFWKSKKAKNNWFQFGWEKFSMYDNLSTFTLDSNYWRYDRAPERISFAFADVTEDGKRKIVNLLNRRFLFSSRPSVAYDYSQPRKVETVRRFLRLVLAGSRFLHLPGTIQNAFDKFIKSMYVPQMRTEGALYGYLEANSMSFEMGCLQDQMTNPFTLESL